MPKSIKGRLTAAVSMLLIGTIMMVSTTYAWFTLSTAPEVKGITANVGANGNLEIMLLDASAFASDADNLGKEPLIGDSMVDIEKVLANVTWGNLVDLSDASYGLSLIALAPSALNLNTTTDGGTTTVASGEKGIGASILMAPSYGSDGRVNKVDRTTTIGKYSGSSFIRADAITERAGVSAIGVASTLSVRQSTYRNAVSAISSNLARARNAAQQSFVDNGENLANMLMKIVTSEDPVFTVGEVEYFIPMISSVKDADEFVFTAIKYAALAYKLSAANTDTLTDAQVNDLQTAILGATGRASLEVAYGGSLPTDIGAALTQYETTESHIASAESAYATAHASVTETNVRALIDAFIKKQNIEVAGKANPTRDDASDIATAAQSGPIPIVLKENSGIYYDIAKSAGEIQAGPITVTVTMPGLSPITASATLSTVLAGSVMVEEAMDEADAAGLPGGAGALAMSEVFGYIVDLGFRTNASGSKLLIQDTEMQRVYTSDNPDGASTNALTQGAGTYLSFDAGNLTTDEVKALMGSIRVVFVEPTVTTDTSTNETSVSYEIIRMAAPDLSAEDTTYSVDGNTVKANLAFYNYTPSIVNGNEVKITLGEKINSKEIVELEQNKAKKISVIVYLDGDAVDNTMVSNDEISMSGKLNLQFASDATLIPMENAGLRSGS